MDLFCFTSNGTPRTPCQTLVFPMSRREELFEREDTLDFDVRLWGAGGLILMLRALEHLRGLEAARAVFATADRSLWTPPTDELLFLFCLPARCCCPTWD